jgi:ankyrin repeat protein
MKNIRGYIEHIRESESADRLGKELIEAAKDNDIDLCKELIDEGATIDVVDWFYYTALHWAVDNGNADIAKLLIDEGADLTISNVNGWMPLHLAAYKGRPHMVKLFIDAGANVDIESDDDDKETPLDVAISEKHPDVAKLLIKAGAKIDLKAKFGTFKGFSDFFGGDIKWIPLELIPPEWRDTAKFTGTFGGFYWSI